jgi:hypothetical protein
MKSTYIKPPIKNATSNKNIAYVKYPAKNFNSKELGDLFKQVLLM